MKRYILFACILISPLICHSTEIKKSYTYISPKVDWFINVPAASSSTYRLSWDAGVSTVTLAAGATVFTSASGGGILSEPTYGKNVVMYCSFANYISTAIIAGTLKVDGKDCKGNTVSETISVSSWTNTGSKAFSQVDTLTLTMSTIRVGNTTEATPANNMEYAIGTGTKIGLYGNIKSSTAGTDVFLTLEADAETTTYTLDADNDTIDFVTDPNGTNDYQVFYRSYSR